MDPVIYCIRCLTSGKIYIGSTINKRARWAQHLTDLRGGRHANRFLQRLYLKYGEGNLHFSIVELVGDIRDLINREQYFIDHYQSANSEFGMNMAPAAGSQLGFKHSEESRRKMSIAGTGKIKSPGHRAKISASNRGLKKGPSPKRSLSDLQAVEAARLYREGMGLKKLGKIYGCCSQAVSNSFSRIGFDPSPFYPQNYKCKSPKQT